MGQALKAVMSDACVLPKVDFVEPWMSEEEAKDFREELSASMADHEAGRVIDGATLIAELRALHTS